MKRVLLISIVALAILVPGLLIFWLWPFWIKPPRAAQEPPVKVEPTAKGAANPLAAFDLRDVIKGATRVKLWVTPPGTKVPVGVEFVGRDRSVTALVSKHGASGFTSVPMPAGWVDRLNAAIKGSAAPSAEGPGSKDHPAASLVSADLAWEVPGEAPRRFLVSLDAQGPGWAVLDEIIRGYGFVSYTVKKGDTPEKIAKTTLNDAKRWPEIQAANPAMRPDHLVPGEVIKVPKK